MKHIYSLKLLLTISILYFTLGSTIAQCDVRISNSPTTIAYGNVSIYEELVESFTVTVAPGASSLDVYIEPYTDDENYFSNEYYTISFYSNTGFTNALSFTAPAEGCDTVVYILLKPLGNSSTYKDGRISVHNEFWDDYCETSCSSTIRLADIGIWGNTSSQTLGYDASNTPSASDSTDFGNITVGSDSLEITYTIKNTKGGPPATLGKLVLVAYEVDKFIEISGAGASHFSVTLEPSDTIITAGSTVDFTVKYKPTSAGTHSATVSIDNNVITPTDKAPYVFNIQGTGAAPEIDIKGNNNTVSIADGDASPSSADSTDIGSIDLETETQAVSFWIHNTGSVNLILTDQDPDNGEYVYITGTHASDYAVTTQPDGTIAGEDSSIFIIEFNPSAAGIRSATINVQSNDANEGTYDFAVQGRGITPEMNVRDLDLNDIADGDDTPSEADKTDFGSINVTSGTKTNEFVIENLASGDNEGDLLLTDDSPYISITGDHSSDFSVTLVPSSTIAAGDDDNFRIQFNPSATGLREATVSIANNDSDENPYNFAIQGTGIKGAPSSQAIDIIFSNIDETTMTVSWTRGNGDYVLLVARAGGAITSDPSDGTEYTANANYGSGGQVGTGNYVLYNGSDAEPSVNITGLTSNITYYFKAYEFNNTGDDTDYNIANGATGNPASQITVGTITWTGSSNSGWTTTGNWTPEQAPTQYTNVIIEDEDNLPEVTASATVNNADINPNAAISISSDRTLTINEVLTINATSSGIGRIILEDNTASVSVGDSAIVETYIENDDLWHYVSMPVTAAKLNTFENYYAWKWNESTASWSNLTNGLMDLTVCQGYSVKYGSGSSSTVQFSGTINSGNNSISVTNASTGNDDYGWNLVGNPYASTIDWDASSGWSRSNIDPTVYQYNGSTGTYGSYNYQTDVALGGGSRYIAPTQGFFIHCDVTSSTLQMDNRVMVNEDKTFLKEGDKGFDDQKTLIVKAYNAANANLYDETAVLFFNKATDTYERNYDSFKLLSANEEIPQIYTVLNDSLNIAMNSYSSLYDTVSVPLYLTVGEADTYRIAVTQSDGFDVTTEILLEDLSDHSITDITSEYYEFSSDSVNDSARFVIHFRPDINEWIGNSSDWNSAANWGKSAVPDGETANALISSSPAGGNFPVIADSIVVNNLTINPGAKLTINESKYLNVFGMLTLKSDSTGYAQLIDCGNLLFSGSGKVIVEKYLDGDRWWYVAPPVSNASSSVFNALNTDHKLYYWNETNSGTHGWNRITDNTTNLYGTSRPIMTGYACHFPNYDKILKFVSNNVNTGTQSIELTRTDAATYNGYNLVGNPYISAIDWQSESGWTKTNIESNSIWYRNDGTFATYNGNNGLGVNGGHQYIQPMQAFWVRIDEGQTAGELGMTNDVRTMYDSVFFKKQQENVLRLTIKNSGKTDESVIYFYKDAQAGFDKFDTEKMLSDEFGVPQLYSIIEENRKLALNSLGANGIQSMQLGYIADLAGYYSINATDLSTFNPQTSIILEDKYLNITIDLKVSNTYEFYTSIGEYNDRFTVHVSLNSTAVTPIAADDNLYAIHSFNHTVYIQHTGGEIFSGTIVIYDMVGKELIRTELSGNSIYTIPLEGQFNNYLVRLFTERNVVSKKVFIK